jgi:hypothetical protein
VRQAGLALLLLAALARADVAVGANGEVWRGAAEIRREEEVAVVGTKRIPLGELYLVEKDDGTLLYAPDFAARVRGYEYLAREHERGAYVELVREAVQVRDFVLARLLLEKAERAGLSSAEAGKLKAKIEAAEKKDSAKGEVRSERLAKEAAVHEAHFGELLAKRAQVALDGGADGARLLREALRAAPDSELAATLLAKIAPGGFAIGGARTWLDWHLDLESAGARIVAGPEPMLDEAQDRWRKDLHGVHADPILLITPVEDSHVVGRCLAHGRLTCRALSELFATEKPVRSADRPMKVFLFESQKEYATTTGTGGKVEEPAFLMWTAGHYDPGDGVSRFYWHKDPDAERRIVGTCVHELTHHWLQERNPRARASDRPDQPGFWIVEGFATLMEEGEFDVETGRWDLFNPRSRSLDVLRSAGEGRLIPWADFYALSQIDFATLPPDDQMQFSLEWNLMPTIVSTRRLFYEQAAATCQFLYHAEDGKYRGRLIDYVCDYYDGKADRLSVVKSLGWSPEDLGRRVLEFAKAVGNGWRPG